MRTLTNSPKNRVNWKRLSSLMTVIIWRTSWNVRQTPCVYRPGMPKSVIFLGVSAAVWLSAACCWKNRICCCWTNQPTTWMRNLLPGWNASCTTTRAPLWRSPTTVTSSIMSPAGSSNSTAVKVFRGKATTPAGWSRKMPVWRRKPLLKLPAVSLSRKSWSGSVRIRKAASPKARPVWPALRN